MPTKTTINTGAAALWASAFLIGAMIILQAGRLPGNVASAEMSTNRGAYSLLTIDSGRGDDARPDELLYVIDSHDQLLFVYEIEDANRGGIYLRAGGSLANLFANARH